MLETFGWIYLPVNASVLPSSREFLSRSNTIRAGIPRQSVIEQALQQVKNNEYMDLDSIREIHTQELAEPEALKQVIAPLSVQNVRSSNYPPKGRKEFAIMKENFQDSNSDASSSSLFSWALSTLSSWVLKSNSFFSSTSSTSPDLNQKEENNELENLFMALPSSFSLPTAFAGAKDIFNVLLTSVTAVLQILTVCFIGTMLSFKGVLDNKTSTTLGNMVFNILLPCLLFTDMALTINVKQIYAFISITVYAALYPLIGIILGKIVKFFCSPPPEIERGIMMSICFGNAAFLPLTLIATVATSRTGIFAVEGAEQTAIQYISVYVSAFSLVYWTVAPHYMSAYRPPSLEEEPCDLEKEESEEKDQVEMTLFLDSSNLSLLEIDGSPSDDTEKEVQSLYETLMINQELFSNWLISILRNVKETSCGFLKKFLSPPTIAVLSGLAVGLFIPLKHLLFSHPSEHPEEQEEGYVFVPFEFLTNAMVMVGAAALPCSMIVLGVNLSSGPTRDKINKRTIFGVTTARLFLLPLISMAITLLLSKYHLLPDDPILKFVLMLEGATPSAMSLVIICQKNGYGEKDMATLQFWVYVSSALSLTIFVSLFMYILQ